MISIRPFKDADNQSMTEIEKLCPQGDENCAIGVDKRDVIARYKMYDNWNVLVAEEDGKIAGWIGWTVKSTPERKDPYVYITEIMVHPAFQRNGIATKLLNKVEENAQEKKSSYVYCYIYEPNGASKSLFHKMGYTNVRDIKTPEIATYKKSSVSSKYSTKPIDKKDFSEVVGFINRYYSGFAHFVPFTSQSFEARLKSIPSYGFENFWVTRDEDNKIIACAGLWDNTKLANLYYAREPKIMKIMKLVLGALSYIAKVPKFPAEGEYFKLFYIADCAYDEERPDALLSLLKQLCNCSIDKQQDCLMTALDPEDPAIKIMKMLRPQIETFSVFAKSLEGNLPAFSPFYVDIRDMIP
jgi:ribosomal protein S18 acetylase RimI-like enzyme